VIQLESVSKAYGGQPVFRDITWTIVGGERIGLVGPNGAGKTTLCRILAGAEEPDEGRVSRARGTTVGYLPQEVAVAGDRSVLGETLSGFDEVWALEREMETVAAALAAGPADAAALTARYGDLQHRFEALGGYRLETEAKTILGGLGFGAGDFLRPITEFSGGWRMRVALAAALFAEPDLLLLDEPTNYLDLEGARWLEARLKKYPHTALIISHDRELLNNSVDAILHLREGKLDLYTGGYDDFEKRRGEKARLQSATRAKQEAERAHLQSFVDRFRAKASKAAQAQSRMKRLAKLEPIAAVIEERVAPFTLPSPPRPLAPP